MQIADKIMYKTPCGDGGAGVKHTRQFNIGINVKHMKQTTKEEPIEINSLIPINK